MSHTRLHNIWLGMRQRCEKPNCTGWQKYGAKGIRVCKEWNNFECFRDWALKNGYNEHLTLDRINPKGNYEPSNCRWATQKVQQNNRSNNVYLTYNGETKNLSEWSEETGIDRKTLYNRIKHGWDAERILKQPKRKSPTPRVKTEKPPEQEITVRFNPKKIDVVDVLAYASCISIYYPDIKPYGKASGVKTVVGRHNVYIYRNPTGYVIDFRESIFDKQTGGLKSNYCRSYRELSEEFD